MLVGSSWERYFWIFFRRVSVISPLFIDKRYYQYIIQTMISKLAILFVTALATTASAEDCTKCTAFCRYRGDPGEQPCGNECIPRGDPPTTPCDGQGQKPNCACFAQTNKENNHWTCCKWCSSKSEASGDSCVPRGTGNGAEGCACNSRDYVDA